MSGFEDFSENSLDVAVWDNSVEMDEIREFIQEVGIERVRDVLLNDLQDEAAEEIQRKSMSIVRSALASIINPARGSSASLEAAIIGLAIGFPGLVSMTHQAKRHGVGKAAISKRTVAFADQHGLPPSVYMKSRAARRAYHGSNVRRRKRA